MILRLTGPGRGQLPALAHPVFRHSARQIQYQASAPMDLHRVVEVALPPRQPIRPGFPMTAADCSRQIPCVAAASKSSRRQMTRHSAPAHQSRRIHHLWVMILAPFPCRPSYLRVV